MPVNPDPGLINDDIKPTTESERHWSVLNMASLWVGMVVCVPTYMLAGSLIDQGMNWWQAVLTIMVGNVVVLVPMILNGHAGTKYGVPFPVLARASFGIHGWFGIQTWFGGFAIYQLLNALLGKVEVVVEGNVEMVDALAYADLPILGINGPELACFLLFWVLQVVVITFGVESIRWLETLAAPFLIVIGLALLGWAVYTVGGFQPMLDMPSAFEVGGEKEGQFLSVFIPSLTAMVGFWATLSLNIPDFTRYAKTQKDQIWGQALGLPTTMTLFAFISVAVTAATTVIFAENGVPADPIGDPTILAGKIGGGFTVALSLFALAIATLSTNIAANVVSPANALINLAPKHINFQRGGYITAGLGLAIFPWKLIESTGGYIFTWLIGYSALLGPIVGILIVDYFLLRKTEYDLTGLYRYKGPYTYWNGFNPVALVAFGLAVLPNLPGFFHQAGLVESVPAIFDTIYLYAWFVGFFIASALYLLGMTLIPHNSIPDSEATS
jgi:NCS1 family nucleobase:cation symporter-1